MRGLMQDAPLTLDQLFFRPERLFADKTIVTAGHGDDLETTTFRDWADRTRRLAGAFDQLELSTDARIGTFAWNTGRHLELYFAAPCSGRVLHTLNIRLFAEQITYIVNHAADEVIFTDRSLLEILWPLVDTFETVRNIVVMDDGAGDVPDDPRILDYEALIAANEPAEFAVTDENRAASICYTSGTTGNPKGVVSSHRSIYLHTMGCMGVDSLGISERDVVMPVVPMFHANAWGLAHAGMAVGSAMVMPGPDLSGPALVDLIESQRVTVTAGVPTVWMGVLDAIDGRDVSSLRSIPCGGSAVPRSLSEGYREKVGIPLLQAWGMTETSPIASIAHIRSAHAHLDQDAQADLRASVGTIVPGVRFRITEPGTTTEVEWDGETSGELQVSGPWVASAYYERPDAADSFTDDGWLRTGDVATCTPDGIMRLVDRTKDLIKSGGEWVSSVEVENEIMAHPAVREAAVIGVASEKWMERPLACVVLEEGMSLTHDELIEFLTPRMVRWWLPSATEVVEEIPKTATGKFSKLTLRERFDGYRVP